MLSPEVDPSRNGPHKSLASPLAHDASLASGALATESSSSHSFTIRRACFRVEGLGFLLFFFTLVTGPRRSLRLKLSDARVYEPQIRARLGTTVHFCEVVMGADVSLQGTVFERTPGLTLQGYLAHKKQHPPQDHHKALGIFLP